MIAKLTKGRGFRGALDYDLREEKGQILATNMAGKTAQQLAAEFGEIRKLRPKLGKAVLHVSLSAAPGEKLSDAQWVNIGERYLREMGFTDNQHLITRHTDTGHEHIHILANRITHSGEVVSDSQDWRRQEALMRAIERDYGLQAVAPSREACRRAPTKGEIEQGIRTGQPSARQQIQQLCDAAARDCPDYSIYQARLEAAGVELVPVVQLDGAKLSGLSYRLDGVTMKGSDLGKHYSAAGIQKRGIRYEQNRDLAAVSRSIERDAHRAPGESNRDRPAGGEPERAGAGRDARTDGAGDGRVDRRDTPDAGRHRPPQPGAGREIQPPVERIGPELEGSGSRSATSRRPAEPGRATDGMAALPAGRADGRAYGAARERLLALAGTAAGHSQRTEPASRGRPPETGHSRSLEALQRQVAALGVQRFEVGLRDAQTGQMLTRDWSRAELEHACAWLRRMNARGHDIYLRPAGAHGLVLVDDLKPQALERMKADGFAPAATIETSPGNYQAWVKLAETPVPAEVRHAAARALAQRYEGDPNSADSRHYGRLAGFTNQKPEHTRDGMQPYVIAHECPAKASKRAQALLEWVGKGLDRVEAENERKRRLNALEAARPENGSRYDPVREYQRQARSLMQRYGQDADFSRLDWMIARDMAKSGRFTEQDIERGILHGSPHVESRKAGHLEDYARRTAQKAWDAPEVAAERHQKAQERPAQRSRDRDRGMSL